MPQLGHALIGLGIGAATARDVRSSSLRAAWPGLCVVLAYGPDLVEWLLVWTTIPIVHGVTASLLAVGAASMALAAGLGWFLRESFWVVLIACTAWVSHALADTLAGGVPLLWPWSHTVYGNDLLELDVGTWSTRIVAEVRWIMPVACAGISAAVWRGAGKTAARGVAAAALAAVVAGALLARVELTIVGGAAALIALLMAGLLPTRRWLFSNLVALAPFWLMVAGQLHGWAYTREAECRYRAADYTGALASYAEAARFRPVDGMSRSIAMSALCHRRLGDLATAERLYQKCLERFPESLTAMYGLGLMYLNADDPAYRRPAEAARLIERVRAHTSDPAHRAYLTGLIESARAAAE